MKRFCFLLIFICSSWLGSSQQVKSVFPPVKWYSFEEALQLNAERAAYGLKPKKIFVDVYTDWCGWCKRMDVSTFAHPVIADYLNSVFIPVKLDAERKDTVVINGQAFINENPQARQSSHQLAQILLNGKMSYPSYTLIDETGRTIDVIAGFQNPSTFEVILNFIGSDAYKSTSWDDFQKTFKGIIPPEQ